MRHQIRPVAPITAAVRRRRWRKRSVAVLGVALTLVAGMMLSPMASFAATGYDETAGGVAHTWTNYTNAGGTEGPSIGAYQTVQVACVVPGFRVSDGNTNWYRIASSPWNNAYYVSADAFYNNGATSGSLHGTPYVDPTVPACSSLPTGRSETTGGAASTWTNYTNAGGTQGPTIAAHQTVLISCRLTGFKVQDTNPWWYRVASAPWSNNYYVSADAFYNNGATSGSLHGTPFVDQAVPVCAGAPSDSSGGTKPTPKVTLAKGPAAPAGYRYAISLTGFAANTVVSIICYDSVSSNGFYTFSLKTNASGSASTAIYCYSGDGPDHWVVAGGLASNHVRWSATTGSSGGGVAPPPPPAATSKPPTTAISMPAFELAAPRHANPKVDGSPKSLLLLAAFKTYIGSCWAKAWGECYALGKHYLDKTGSDKWIPMDDLLNGQPGIVNRLTEELRARLSQEVKASMPAGGVTFQIYPFSGQWVGVRPTLTSDWYFAIGRFSATAQGDIWFGPLKPNGDRQIQIRYKLFLQDTYNFDPGWEHAGAFRALVDQGRASDFRVYGQTKTVVISTSLKKFNPLTMSLQW